MTKTPTQACRGVTVLHKRNADAVKLCLLQGLSNAAAGKVIGVSQPTVTRMLNRFRREAAIFIGPLDRLSPTSLRETITTILDNAAAARRTRA